MNRFRWIRLVITIRLCVSSLPVEAGHVTQDTSSWVDADNTCSLEIPNIDWEDMTIGSDVTISGDTWVGYVKSYAMFEYLGCWWTEDLEHYTKVLSTHSDVGVCYSACHTEYFAITAGEKNCRCLSNIDDYKDPKLCICNKTCDTLVCGNKDGSYTSVYKHLYDEDNHLNGEYLSGDKPYCLFKDGSGKSFRGCDSDEDIEKMNRKISDVKGTGEWSDLVTKCPLPNSSVVSEVSEPSGEYWTTTVAVLYIPKDAVTNDATVLYGYVTKGGDLKFKNKGDEDKFPSLCEDDPEMASSTDDTTSDTTDQTEHTSTGDNSSGLNIGIGMCISLLAVAAVLIFAYWLRFWKKYNKNEEGQESPRKFQINVHEDGPSNETAGEDDVKRTYAIPSFPDDSRAAEPDNMPVYHILEPISHGKTSGNRENTYDVCSRDGSRKNIQTDNVYNTAGSIDVTVDVYDHVGEGRETVGARAVDHSYDVCGHVKTDAANQNDVEDTYI